MTPNTASPWPEPDDELEPGDYDDHLDESRLPITLTPGQGADLRAVLDRELLAGGCDNTLRIAKQWAAGARVPWPRLRRELQANGWLLRLRDHLQRVHGRGPAVRPLRRDALPSWLAG